MAGVIRLYIRHFLIGIASIVAFIWQEHRVKQPMMPLDAFKKRNFAVGNLATLAIYAALSIATFVVSIFVQQIGDYSATQAGMAMLPITIIMFFLSSRFGDLSSRFGPRRFMGVGPIVSAIGSMLLLMVDESVRYWSLLPGIIVFGIGLSVTVAPLTFAVLGAVDDHRSGIASAINNAAARIAGLIGIAALGPVIGQQLELDDFHRVVLITAGLLFVGGVVSLIGIRDPEQ